VLISVEGTVELLRANSTIGLQQILARSWMLVINCGRAGAAVPRCGFRT